MSDCLAVIQLPMLRSGRQDLTALGTAAGKHLAAVGSSHSHPETVDLGSVATAGLIGTLHSGTPPVKFTYARQPNWPQQHILSDYIHSHAMVL